MLQKFVNVWTKVERIMGSEEVKSWTEAVTFAFRGWRKPSNTWTRMGSTSVKIYPGNCRHISAPLLHKILL